MTTRRFLLAAVLQVSLCVAPLAADAADEDSRSPERRVRIRSGDLLIANGDGWINGRAGIVKVDPVTGAQTLVAKGTPFAAPNAVVVGADGALYVADASTSFCGAVDRIDARTGSTQILATQGIMGSPHGIAVDQDGNLLVAWYGIYEGCSGDAYGLIRVDPSTGAQSVVSQGLSGAAAVAVESDGQIVVVPASDPPGGILRVDPVTGAVSTIAHGGVLGTPWDLAIGPDGDIFALNSDVVGRDIVRVDPQTGAQTVVSSGGLLDGAIGIAVAANGDILVVHPGPDPNERRADGLVIRIDPVSGAQTVLTQGQRLVDPYGISVAP